FRHALERLVLVLTGTDPGDVLDGHHPDLAVSDLAGLGGRHDRLGDPGRVLVADEHVDPDLGHEVHGVLRTAVDLRVAPLTAVAARLAHRQATDSRGLERGLHIIELVRLDHRRDELRHHFTSDWTRAPMDSYAASPCSARSMLRSSASSETRHPIVNLMARPRTRVTTAEIAMATATMMAWTASWLKSPP